MIPQNVKPGKWLWDAAYPIRILYNDGHYSIIWGKYEGVKCMGTRWNGGKHGRGYPGQGSYSLWHVEPDFVAIVILQRLLNKALNQKQSKHLNLVNTQFALAELTEKMLDGKSMPPSSMVKP